MRITLDINLNVGVSSALLMALAGASQSAILAAGDAGGAPIPEPRPEPVREPLGGDNGSGGAPAVADLGAAAAAVPGEVDAAGWPWDASLHASTQGKTKDGLWRMKVGVSRPDPKPGFPVNGAAGTGTGSGAVSGGSAPAAAAPASATDEDDEFAAFAQAQAKVGTEDAAAAAGAPARKWTDADLGALCNQAAIKLGDPGPVREIIAAYIPADATAHSRNVPEDKREAFAQAIETKADIKFAG